MRMELIQPTASDLAAAILNAECRAAAYDDLAAELAEEHRRRAHELNDESAELSRLTEELSIGLANLQERREHLSRREAELDRVAAEQTRRARALVQEAARLAHGDARRCGECSTPLPRTARSDAEYCSGRCRARACRRRNTAG